jgi:hypothetical protein
MDAVSSRDIRPTSHAERVTADRPETEGSDEESRPAPAGGAGNGLDEPFGADDSVTQCLEIMKEVAAEQPARARHLDTKTGALAGFTATVFTLNATLGRPLLESLGGTASDVAKLFFVLSVAALGLSALAAVAIVLRPMGHRDLDDDQIDAYSDRPKVTTPPADLRMTWLRTVTETTISDRAAGDRKSRYSNVAVALLVIGILGVAGQSLTLVFSGEQRPTQTPTSPSSKAPTP